MGEATLIVRQGERLNLNRCIEIAQKMQPNIAFAVNTVYATRARVSQAQSGYYPQVDASAGWSRSDPAAEVGAGSSKSSGLYTGSVNLKQNIYDFGRTSGQVNAERYNLESSRSDLENTRNQTAFNVKAAYYGALLAGKNRDVSQEAVKQFEEHLLQAKGFYEVGTKPKIDVTRAEVDLSGAKVGLIKAENSLRIAKINLRNAMGIPEAPLFDIEDDLTFQGFDIGLEEAVSRAFSSRPDLKSLIERKKSSEENVELAKKSYYPVLSGSAAYNWAGESFPLERGWNLGAVVTMPVFSGFLTKYQVEESRANLNAVNANLELLRQNVILDVQQAWFNLKEALERVPAAELALRQAAENLELANARYATGVGSPIEITDASAAYINAKLTHFQSLSDYKVAEANLEKAMGKR
ncbi:MAG: TolC family protein [Deltaproteobacteria bacterium]|nr:TolC family protein [Deltaproteobacteria bacterium]